MITIENEIIRVKINPQGAELNSVYLKSLQLEYLWQGDPAFWAKQSPVLFPVVGTLKENRYQFKNDFYELGRHGFAREKMFTVEESKKTSAVFLLKSDDDTRKVYPFEFEFRVIYEIRNAQLNVTYEVTNIGSVDLLFSVGGHPAFSLPLAAGTNYDDYYLEFEKEENAARWPISADGLIESGTQPVLDNSRYLPLSKELFQKDAIVFKNLSSTEVSIRSDKTEHGIWFDFADFPYLGIWAAKGADFVCIEPWCGIADAADSNQDFSSKEGINSLPPDELFSRTWTIELF